MSQPAKNAPKAEKAVKDLEPDAANVVGGTLNRSQTLASNVQKKADDTIRAQQQKIG